MNDHTSLLKWLAEDMAREFANMPDPEPAMMGGVKFAAAWMPIVAKSVRVFCLCRNDSLNDLCAAGYVDANTSEWSELPEVPLLV
jgi:hypothetical protein